MDQTAANVLLDMIAQKECKEIIVQICVNNVATLVEPVNKGI